MKKHSASDLDTLYNEMESVDSEFFSEARTNLLLIDGQHYTKKRFDLLNRSKDFRDLADDQKIRLTKNHTKKIVNSISNQLVSANPGVAFMPKNTNELADQKATEFHTAVWNDAKEKYDIDGLIDDWADDFASIGEVCCKIFFDRNIGEVVGYEPETNESGETVYEEDGVTPKKGQAKAKGGFVFESVYGFNLLRPAECKDVRKAEYLCIRKMANIKELKQKFPQFKDKIEATADKTYRVFDTNKGKYTDSKNEGLVTEWYFRPCLDYPKGYYYIKHESVILAEGELPGGIFPIAWMFMDKTQTTPRGIGPCRTIRPYQVEINRSASKIAEHQTSVGDDKVLIQNGTQVSQGNFLPGVRALNYTGAAPTILAGRDGSQYLKYSDSVITELYAVMDENEGDEAAQVDPYTMLFKSAAQKKRKKRYHKRFARFLKEVAKIYLAQAKLYLSDDEVIAIAGRPEIVNIKEFKNMKPIDDQIVVEQHSEDLETKFGKQLVFNHVLQYVGNQLDKKDIGKIIRAMPYSNKEEALSDLTLDYDIATNTILALDRGDIPVVSRAIEPAYMLQRLTNRQAQADYRFLDKRIQAMYEEIVQIYTEIEADNVLKAQRLKSGFIPTDGYLVTCDFYVSDPTNPTKTRRARLPYGAIAWLVKQLEVQGQSLQQLEAMNQGALAQVSDAVAKPNQAANEQEASLATQGATNGNETGNPGPAATGDNTQAGEYDALLQYAGANGI